MFCRLISYFYLYGIVISCPPPSQVVRLREVFPHGPGFVLVFDYMLSDLAEVVRNSEKPLTEVLV